LEHGGVDASMDGHMHLSSMMMSMCTIDLLGCASSHCMYPTLSCWNRSWLTLFELPTICRNGMRSTPTPPSPMRGRCLEAPHVPHHQRKEARKKTFRRQSCMVVSQNHVSDFMCILRKERRNMRSINYGNRGSISHNA
jgi:hypothetical protein